MPTPPLRPLDAQSLLLLDRLTTIKKLDKSNDNDLKLVQTERDAILNAARWYRGDFTFMRAAAIEVGGGMENLITAPRLVGMANVLRRAWQDDELSPLFLPPNFVRKRHPLFIEEVAVSMDFRFMRPGCYVHRGSGVTCQLTYETSGKYEWTVEVSTGVYISFEWSPKTGLVHKTPSAAVSAIKSAVYYIAQVALEPIESGIAWSDKSGNCPWSLQKSTRAADSRTGCSCSSCNIATTVNDDTGLVHRWRSGGFGAYNPVLTTPGAVNVSPGQYSGSKTTKVPSVQVLGSGDWIDVGRPAPWPNGARSKNQHDPFIDTSSPYYAWYYTTLDLGIVPTDDIATGIKDPAPEPEQPVDEHGRLVPVPRPAPAFRTSRVRRDSPLHDKFRRSH